MIPLPDPFGQALSRKTPAAGRFTDDVFGAVLFLLRDLRRERFHPGIAGRKHIAVAGKPI